MVEQLISKQDVLNYLSSPIDEGEERAIFCSDEKIHNSIAIEITMLLQWLHGKEEGLERFVNIMLNPSVAEASNRIKEIDNEEHDLLSKLHDELIVQDVYDNNYKELAMERYRLKEKITELFDHPKEIEYLPQMRTGHDPGRIIIDVYRQIIKQIIESGIKPARDANFEHYLENKVGTYKPNITAEALKKTIDWIQKIRKDSAYKFLLEYPSELIYDRCRIEIVRSIEEPKKLLKVFELTYINDKDPQRGLKKLTGLLRNKQNELEELLQAYCYSKGMPEALGEPNDENNRFGLYEYRYKMGKVIVDAFSPDERHVIKDIMSYREEYLGKAALAILCFIDSKNQAIFTSFCKQIDQ